MLLGWRSVVRRPGRLLTTALAFALAMLVIVLIQGFRNGLYVTYTGMIRNTPVDLWISERGAKGFTGGAPLPAGLQAQVAGLPGVRSVKPLFGIPSISDVEGRKFPLVLVGYDLTSGLGGPWKVAVGRRPGRAGEITLDRAFAGQRGLAAGDRFTVAGKAFEVVGLTDGTNSFMSSVAFLSEEDAGSLAGARERPTFLLVQLSPGAEPADIERHLPDAVEMHEPEHLRSISEEVLDRVMGSPLYLLLGVAFLVGLAVISLTTYSGVLERRAEYGVLRALGISGTALALTVITEVMIGAVVGIGAGMALSVGLAKVAGLFLPTYPIVLTAGALGQTAAMGLAMGLLGALLPIRRLSRMDPSAVFRV